MLSHLFNLEETEVYTQQFKKVKLINKTKEKIYKTNTIFPNNWSPTKCVETIVDAIKNPKNINYEFKINHTFEITSQNNYNFKICINKNGKATFYPTKGINL